MACLHVQLLGRYTGVCLAQSQDSEYVIAFQGRSRLRISPSRYSCSISASGNPLLLPAMSAITLGQHCSLSAGVPCLARSSP